MLLLLAAMWSGELTGSTQWRELKTQQRHESIHTLSQWIVEKRDESTLRGTYYYLWRASHWLEDMRASSGVDESLADLIRADIQAVLASTAADAKLLKEARELQVCLDVLLDFRKKGKAPEGRTSPELKSPGAADKPGTKSTNAGPACLWELRRLKEVQDLNLGAYEITDAGLKHLEELKVLKRLILSNNLITDAGLECLKELECLQELNLSGNQITDAGLKILKELHNLKLLDLTDTKTTEGGRNELRRALPGIRIFPADGYG